MFHDNEFYQNLPANLQKKLAAETFQNLVQQTYFFFNDEINGIKTDPVIVYEIMSCLESSIHELGEEVIKAGQTPHAVSFIMQGCVTVTDEKYVISLVQLTEESFFGDYSVLYNLPSTFNYVVSKDMRNLRNNKHAIMLLNCRTDFFNEICDRYPAFKKFCKSRASLRRAHWTRLEYKIKKSITQKYNNQS